ncbi:hypothetical protein J6590_024647 [Homalodisca vitripennis]|nr:hypothetical protein J6590_024647 [Homalodisca vitripennis]
MVKPQIGRFLAVWAATAPTSPHTMRRCHIVKSADCHRRCDDVSLRPVVYIFGVRLLYLLTYCPKTRFDLNRESKGSRKIYDK